MSELIQSLQERVAPLAAAIPGDSSAGSDCSYDPDFEKVKSEIDKLTAMSGGLPDWPEVSATGDRLLREKSKDLRLLVWSAVGKLQTRGFAGLVEGLVALKQVSELYWDAMQPAARRARARVNLIDWLSEQVSTHLLAANLAAADRAPLEAVDILVKELDGMLAGKLGDAYTGMGAVQSSLRTKMRELPADQPAAAPAAAAQAAAPVAASSPAAAPAASAPSATITAETPRVGDASEVAQALRTVSKTIVECARTLRLADPSQASAYYLLRVGAWLPVRTPPPTEGDKTRIPPPGPEHKKRLEGLSSNEQWLELLNAAEGLAANFLFWLDLHRFSALALDRLGVQFTAARETLGREVVAFVRRCPSIPKLSFADGSPFTDAGTQAWLEEETARWSGGGGGGAGNSRISEEDEEVARRFEEALKLASSGQAAEALALGAQLAARGSDARTRFRANMTVARMALRSNKPEIGAAVLEGLLAEAERHDLENWEPSLCATIYADLLACRRQSGATASEPTDAQLMARLCRLDPAAAIKAGA